MANDQRDFERLVRDTLFERRLKRHGCFVHNEAGEELIACPPAALPVLERLLRDTVAPALSEGTVHTRSFPGLNHVLGTYLVIAARSDPDRAVTFLAGMPLPMHVATLAALRIVFLRKGERYVRGIAPPPQFRDFTLGLAASESEEVRSAADRTLRKVTWGL